MRILIEFCLCIVFILCLMEYLRTDAEKRRLDQENKQSEQTEQTKERDPCSDYSPIYPIPLKPSDGIPKIIVIPLVGIGIGAASFFGAPLILGALGFKAAGIGIGSFAAWVQSVLYAGFIPAGSWFAAFQTAGMTGIVITKGTAITLGTASSGAAFYWYGSEKVPNSEQEWHEMNKKCDDCVINRLNCRLAKEKLFEHLEREKSQIGWFSSIQKEKLSAAENWESFVRLSCECFPVFRNKQEEGEGAHEKELASVFHHYVPYFYSSSAKTN